ncbi:ubiquitin carboxyl-terminal hydrolase 48 [Fopius arisanus]|uniref:ubiquitinyl hydrolase 1 n=1 Tax=Fopius arisanus TaxID=64838 RepID=A0A9R1U304_9HYME|nr:PREDICTED: ubiquitin carboxyl-terminal hydrolase 48-like [Fopius arisanus]
MPPLKKVDLERMAWSWIETVAPEEIEKIHMETAYRIGLKNCKNCKRNCSHNPCCLTGLGEEKYFKSQPAEVASLESSLSELRDPTQYVGLKNLGATCYVNSLIQVWFHNEDMRRIIYKWDITADPEESESLHRSQSLKHPYHPRTVVGQLQYIFAMMQFGNKRLLDPTSLAIALSLDTNAQQDASEFSKLLLAHIENKLTSLALKPRLQRLTQGTYIYVNRCSTCSTEYQTPTTFYELDLQLAPTLREAMDNYLSEEELVGSNKYHCQRCNEKQNAKRFIRLNSLPETLNFQLLRFVFDRESGQKKKVSSYIYFPNDLDMSEYLNCPPGTHLYSLVAVLSHRGPSAHSGHYIAWICRSSGEWYQFSDDLVEKTQGKRIGDGVGDNGKRVPKGFLSSNNAYMLVYKKNLDGKVKKPMDNGKRKETSDSDSSDSIFSSSKKTKKGRKKIKGVDEDFDNPVKKSRKNDTHDDKNDRCRGEDDDVKEEGEGNCSPGDGGETNGVKLTMKENYDKNYQMLNGDAHRAMGCGERDYYEAMEFQKWEVSETLRELVKQENVAHELSLLAVQEEKQKRIEEKNVKRQEVIDFYEAWGRCEGVGERFVWIPTSFISKWLNDDSGGNEGVREIDVEGVMCRHRKMDPGKVHKAKCVPMDATEKLLGKFQITEMLGEDSLCLACVRKKCKTMRFKIELEKDHKEVLEYMRIFKDFNEDSYIIGTDSLKHWRKLAMERLEGETSNDNDSEQTNDQKPSDNQKEEIEEESEPIMNFNEDLLCEHGGLRTPDDSSRKVIPGAAWRILQKYFPKAAEYPSGTEPCIICEERNESAERVKAVDKIKGKLQKDQLSQLYQGKNRNEVMKEKNCHKEYFIVEKGFFDIWKTFVRTGKNAPSGINNGQLLCEIHKGFLYTAEPSSEFYTIVTEEEWGKLTEFYQSDYAIKIVNLGTDEAKLKTDPDECHECMQARIEQERLDTLNYDKATIYIKCIDEGDDNDSTVKSSRCSRTRRRAKGSHELKVSSQITLKELKVMTMGIFKAPPFDQHLMLDERELTGSDQTLASLGVYPEALLKLKVDSVPDNDVDFESDSASREAPSPEKGFKGTGLVPS